MGRGRARLDQRLLRPAGNCPRRRRAGCSRIQARSSGPASCSIGRSSPSPRTARRRIIPYHSRVLAAAPSAAFAARNRSTARPSVRCPSESGAHRFGVAKSGAQGSGESGAQTMFIASCDEPRVGVQARHAAPRWCRPQHLAVRRGAGWRGRIRTFDLLIQSQTTRIGSASRSSNSGRRLAPSESGSVRRTLPEESCALPNSFVN